MIVELMKKGAKATLGIILAILLVACGGGAYVVNRVAHAPNINTQSQSTKYLYVYPGSTWDQVVDSLSARVDVRHGGDLRMMLKNMSKVSEPKVGAYRVEPNSTTLDLYKQLAFGHQSPVRLVIRSLRTPEEMWQRLSEQVMADSAEIARAMTDKELLKELGVSDSTLAYNIVPNTYEVYWSISPEKLVRRLKKEADSFWTDKRRAQADSLGISTREVIILASIVEEESNMVDEYPLIAGLYLNRLRLGMPLQADPTVKYAVGDFGIRRIRGAHLAVENPYNTYKYAGLPPGPIRIPSTAAIDGVLGAKGHKYLYMCAKADFSGYHAFAENFAEHQKNAQAYTRALNERGIN